MSEFEEELLKEFKELNANLEETNRKLFHIQKELADIEIAINYIE